MPFMPIYFLIQAMFATSASIKTTLCQTNGSIDSYGAGLDFVTYYDLVLRGEFAITGNGKSGIFLHLTAPI